MNRILMISSAVALFAAPALAEETDTTAATDATIETQADVNGDGDLETLKNGYTDEHPWVNAAVFVGEEQIAEIERVHFGADDDVDMVVIETDGVAEIGGREVELGLDQLELQAEADGATSFQLAITEAELDAMHTARGSDIEKCDPALLKQHGPPVCIPPIGVAAIDQNVART